MRGAYRVGYTAVAVGAQHAVSRLFLDVDIVGQEERDALAPA